MRASDRAVPSVSLDPVPNIAHWPVRPVIAISCVPTTPYAWDSWATWDDTTPLVWDVNVASPLRIDATCEFTGLEIEYGPPDDHTLFPAGHLVLQLDNQNGQWSQYNVDGSPALSGPGQAIDVWAHNASGNWWLFSGVITRWDERADNTVEIEAFDGFSYLAQPVGTFVPGSDGDHLGQRLDSILTVTGRSNVLHRPFPPGTVALSARSTDNAPLEEMQAAVGSDGGVMFGDADGTVVVYGRTWRGGRGDQTVFPVISDNVASVPIIIWDALVSTNDTNLADTVILQNVDGVKVQAPASISGTVIAETDQQWMAPNEGQTLADALLAAQKQLRVALDEFTLYLLDPRQPDMWKAVDWRLFDALRFIHESKAVGGSARLDITTLITSVAHAITPENWVMTLSTSRSQAYLATLAWDTTQYLWDDPAATWNY